MPARTANFEKSMELSSEIKERMEYLVEVLELNTCEAFDGIFGMGPKNRSIVLDPFQRQSLSYLSIWTLYAKLNVNLNWLFSGEGEPFIERENNDQTNDSEVD